MVLQYSGADATGETAAGAKVRGAVNEAADQAKHAEHDAVGAMRQGGGNAAHCIHDEARLPPASTGRLAAGAILFLAIATEKTAPNLKIC